MKNEIKKIVKILGVFFFFAFLITISIFLKNEANSWLAPTQHPSHGNIQPKPFCQWLIFNASVQPPQSVQNLPLSLTSTKVSWQAMPGMHSYKVSVGSAEEGPFTEVDVVVHPTGFLDVTDLTQQGEYYFVIQASTDGTTWSNYSDPAYIQMPTTPGIPTGLTTSIYSETALDLSWTAPANNGGASITGYMIERQTSGGTWSTIVANTGNANTTYRNTGLTENTEYGYRVSTITVATSAPSTVSTKFSGHCVTTTADCASGYTSILGGSQSGCATAGPVTSPYSGSGNNRYRILSNGQTLTESGCVATGTEQRTMQAQVSTDSGSTYAFTGSTVICRQCGASDVCARACSRWWGKTGSNCLANTCSSGYSNSNNGCPCCAYNGAATAWNRTCSDQTTTIRWCCRN